MLTFVPLYSALLLSFSGMCFVLFFHCFLFCFVFMLSLYSFTFFVDAPLILSCSVDHVLDWQPRIMLLGIRPDWLMCRTQQEQYHCFCLLKFFLCPCMAINVSIQYNGGLLPDITLLTQIQCYYYTIGDPV